MAAGALAHSHADLSLAVTGIAGPGGATPSKPVGLVWLGWAVRGGDIGAEALQLDGDRATIRARSVDAALERALQLARNTAANSSAGTGRPSR